MPYKVTEPRAGTQPIANTETVAKHPLGTILKAFDPTYGEGEFIYLKGVASTAIGDCVIWDVTTYQTTRAPTTSLQGRPIAFAMSANVANQFGWYQIGGSVLVNKSAVTIAANVAIGINSTAKIGNSASGKQILNARGPAASVASAATTTVIEINRPFLQGRIT